MRFSKSVYSRIREPVYVCLIVRFYYFRDAACDEPFDPKPFGRELRVERLKAEGLSRVDCGNLGFTFSSMLR